MVAFATEVLAGGSVPVYSFEEQACGFGRVRASWLPYEPSGENQDEALRAASTTAGEHAKPEHADQYQT